MTSENLIGRLLCLTWSKNREIKELVKAAVKAIYVKLGVRVLPSLFALHANHLGLQVSAATIQMFTELVPSLERICIHTIQHDTNLGGLRDHLSTMSEVLKQSLNLDTLLCTSRTDRKTLHSNRSSPWYS